MPIPNKREYKQAIESNNPRKELDQLYAGYNWFPELTYQMVGYNPSEGLPTLTTYHVDAKRLGCSCGLRGSGNYASIEKSGVYLHCAGCRRTTGPISNDEFEVVTQVYVSVEDGINFCTEHNQIVPLVLERADRGKRNLIAVYR